jgi:ring-1,2-phenylacetyl-CoA epoxidase subunit PaaA
MVSHEDLLARLARGERIENRDEMSQEYFDHLVNLMIQQADSELAGGLGYVPWIAKAPTISEKLAVASIVRDEIRHAKVMYALLSDLGVDVEGHVSKHDYDFRIGDAAADLGTDRVAADGRVNIFYYPIDSWCDFIMFNFCMDRGAGHQLEDVKECSYAPWGRAIAGIFQEELSHVGHGNFWVKKLSADPATKAEAQAALDKWYVRTMNVFGRPQSKKNAEYRRLELKRRSNQEVREAFCAEIHPLIESAGLAIPRWEPEWATEDAVAIAG